MFHFVFSGSLYVKDEAMFTKHLEHIRFTFFKIDASGSRRYQASAFIIRFHIGWTPQVKLADGLKETYLWIENQLSLQEKD